MLGKHTLNPDEKTELKVVFETEGRPGPFEKKVIFSTNLPGLETVEVFHIKGMVREAPAAKIRVEPRKISLQGIEASEGKKQIVAGTNEGSLPLTIVRIQSRDGSIVYFDGKKQGNIVIESNQTKSIELQFAGKKNQSQEYILIESNAKNAGKTGYFLTVQYGAAAN
jgi:hypothetical protein